MSGINIVEVTARADEGDENAKLFMLMHISMNRIRLIRDQLDDIENCVSQAYEKARANLCFKEEP